MELNLTIHGKQGAAEYRLDLDASLTILDALETLQAAQAPNLVYRHSCHHGSCGTCGALVNGKPRLMCLAKVGEFENGHVDLQALRSMTELQGIAVWPGPLFESLPDTRYLKVSEYAAADPADVAAVAFPVRGEPAVNATGEAERLEDCIECGLCVSACPVYGEFQGPAALAAVGVQLAKDPGTEARMLELAARPDGARRCERAFECSRACPRGVAPGRRITELLARLKGKEGDQ